MRRFLVGLVPLMLIASLVPAWAQEAVRAPVEIGASGDAYLKALRFRRIDTDVTYFDPAGPAPDLKTRQQPDAGTGQTSDDGSLSVRKEPSDTARWIVGMVTAAILAAIAYGVYRFGGGMTVSLGREARNVVRDRPGRRTEAPDWAEKTGTLEDILHMKDRRQALVLLMRKVLAATVAVNGILMQRSWTARDALRHLPPGQRCLDQLRDLVLASERVHFGGRDVTEQEFRAHVDQCRPLLGTGPV